MEVSKNMEKGVKIEVNVTKIVRYVCFAGIVIVGIIFGERAYEKYLESK